MKKLFKTLATLLSVIISVSSLSPIRAEGESTTSSPCKKRMRTEKHHLEEIRKQERKQEEEWRQRTINDLKKMLTDSKSPWGCNLFGTVCGIKLYSHITPEDIKSRTNRTQYDMRMFETRLFPTGQNICSPEEFKALYLAFRFRSLYRCISCYGYISKYSIIDLLNFADLEIPETFESDHVKVFYSQQKLSIIFYYKYKLVCRILL